MHEHEPQFFESADRIPATCAGTIIDTQALMRASAAGIVGVAMALVACATNPTNPYAGYDLTVVVQSPIALDGLKVYYDTTGGSLPTTPPPTASELATDQASAEWSNVLAIDMVDVAPPAQMTGYGNSGHGPRFVAIIGIQDVDGIPTMVNGGSLPEIDYLDGPDSDPIPEALAMEGLDLAPL
jgi:hypothetical protein